MIPIKFKFKPDTTPTAHNAPLLVSFANGIPPGIDDEDNKISFELYANSDTSGRHAFDRRLVATSTHTLDDNKPDEETTHVEYEASNFGDQSYRKQPYKFAIALYHPKKDQIKLAEVAHIYNMQHALQTSKRKILDEKNEDSAQDRYAQNRILIESFGSKKRKKQLRSAVANRVDMANQDGADDIAKSLHLDQDAEIIVNESDALESTRSLTLPPYQLEAEHPSEIYDVVKMIGGEEWSSLDVKNWSKLAKKPSLLREKVNDFPQFIYAVLQSCANIPVKILKFRLRTLIFLNYLLKFATLPKGRIDERMMTIGASELIANRILQLFTENSQTSKIMETKLMFHICVLALTVREFSLKSEDLQQLSHDLRITTTTCSQYLSEVGCKSSGMGAERKVELKAPLVLPSLRKKRQSAKK